MSFNKSLFIVFEGIDGSGKSTQISMLKQRFLVQKLKIFDTFEPTDGPMGMLARNIMKGRVQTDQSALAALFLADRLDHINNPINGMKKRMSEGYHIVCSRYYFSNYAFQSEYVPIEWIVNMNSLCRSFMKPDVIFYLNSDPIECSKRIKFGRVDYDMYENEEKAINTHAKYIKYFEEYGKDENIHLIDVDSSLEGSSQKIWDIIRDLINKIH